MNAEPNTLTKTQEKILGFLLKAWDKKNTIREIARKLDKSYTLTYNNISDLEKKELVLSESVPPARIIRLNENAPEDMLIGLEFKRKQEFLAKCPWIRIMLKDVLTSIENPFFILLVFGSYAKSTNDEKSDLDMLAIVQDKKQISHVKEIILEIYTKVKKSLNIVDISEFKEMLRNTEKFNIGTEAKKNHILLYGAEQYYNLIKICKRQNEY